MTERSALYLLVPLTYVGARLVSSRLVSGIWDLRGEAVALMIIVPAVQLVVLDLLRWLRGRGI